MTQTTFELLNAQELLPSAPPPRQLAEIEIEDVKYDAVGPAPSPELIRSIRMRGVQTPISVLDYDGEFLLISGRRRILASITCGRTTIPAIVHSDIEPDSAALTDHALRKSNPAGELRSIERLLAAEHTEAQIASATGLTVGTIRARLKLCALPPVLRAGFDSGAIALQTAELVTKLSPDEQEAMGEQYLKYGALTAKDVKERRRVQRDAAVENLPLFDEATDTPRPSDEGSTEKRATVDEYIAMTGSDVTSPRDLAAVALAFLAVSRHDDVQDLLLRIMELPVKS